MDRGAWWAAVHGVARVEPYLATKPPPQQIKRHILQNRSWKVKEKKKQSMTCLEIPVLFITFKAFVCVLSRFSHVKLFVILWTVAFQALLSMGFSRQDCWSGLPCPSPGELPDPGIKSRSSALLAVYLPSEPLGEPTFQYSYSLNCIKHNIIQLNQEYWKSRGKFQCRM